MHPNWKDLFAFTSGERNGIIVLIILLWFPLLFFIWPRKPSAIIEVAFIDVSADSTATQDEGSDIPKTSISYSKKNEPYQNPPKGYKKGNRNTMVKPFKPFDFDPNKKDTPFWKSIGMSNKQQASIVKYLEKGGEFKTKSDVKKLYVVSDSLYLQIKPYLLLPDTLQSTELPELKTKKITSKYNSDAYKNLVVELNTCDTTDLKALKGIASYSAIKIVNYRNRLGGFVSVEQLYEIKGLRKETIVELTPKFTVDTNLVVQFELNTTSASEFVKHPYFTWHMAKEIEGQRKFGKKYKKVSDLLKYGLLDEQLYIKIVPYVKL